MILVARPQANYAGSVITGGVPLLDALLGKSGASYYGRKLSQFPNYLTPGRTGLFQTGSKAVQVCSFPVSLLPLELPQLS